MSVAEQTALTSKSPRRIPSTVRLRPQVVNDLCTHPGSEKARADKGQSAAGLLFGTAEQDVLRVEAFKAFPAVDSTENGSPQRECLDAAFERFLATAKMDPDLTSLHLVGWYCIRDPGDIAPLFDNDIEFHNRRFRRATDIALILKPKQHAGASIELYGRSSLKPAISRQDCRSGSLLLDSAAPVNAPIDIAMRETVDDDYYLRVFQVLDSLDRAERRGRWKRIALWLKAMTPSMLRPGWMRTRIEPDVHTQDLEASGLRTEATIRMMPLSGRSTSRQVNSPIPPTRSTRRKLHWISSAVLLVLAMGVALVWLYSHPLLSALPRNALFLRLPASTPLDMQVAAHADGSLLVRWDAHSAAVQSAKNGTMQIDDASERRNLQLDSNQLANGSILYTPTSKDLTFRLEVFDRKGSPVSESMRVVNGSKARLAPHTIPNRQPNTLAKATPVPHAKATSVALEKGPPDIKIRPGRNAPGPSINTRITSAARLSSAPMPTPSPSGETASSVVRPRTQKVLAPERKIQRWQNPATFHSAGLSTGERASKKTDPSPRKPELHKAVEDLPSAHPSVGSPQPVVMKNSTSTTYVPARPLKQVVPSARNLESSVPSGATDVEVEVRIDEEGRVTEAWVVNNKSNDSELLTSAALAAAKEWIFEPAKMHGKSVPGDHTIEFHFRPQVAQQ